MSTKIDHLIEVFFIWSVIGGAIFFLSNALVVVRADLSTKDSMSLNNQLNIVQSNSVFSNSEHFLSNYRFSNRPKDPNKIRVVVTAYSSCPMETDDDPYITASGNWVQEGIVATNFLPFGTEIKIPEVFGNRVFVVQDRMHHRKKYQVDIWFSSKAGAIDFGVRHTYILLIEEA